MCLAERNGDLICAKPQIVSEIDGQGSDFPLDLARRPKTLGWADSH